MISAKYTSPLEEAFRSVDISQQFMDELTFEDFALVGNATRLIMEAALANPEKRSHEWVGIAMAETDLSSSDLLVSGLMKKANHARALLNDGVLVTDKELIEMSLDNGFKKPVKS